MSDEVLILKAVRALKVDVPVLRADVDTKTLTPTPLPMGEGKEAVVTKQPGAAEDPGAKEFNAKAQRAQRKSKK